MATEQGETSIEYIHHHLTNLTFGQYADGGWGFAHNVEQIREMGLGMIFSLPPLGIFLGIYFGTGNLIVGAILGFSVHFVTLAFSARISKFLTLILS